VDPHPKAGEAYRKLSEVLKSPLGFFNQPFEDVQLPENLKADLVLTSPPYFSVERYSNDSKQSWVRYPTLSLWEERFLHVLLAKSFNALKDGGWALINIADCRLNGKPVPLVESTLRLAALVGFEHVGTLSMQLANFGRAREPYP
jgi:DNA modification methylase